MPAYFLDLYNDMIAIADEPVVLPDLSAAILHATTEARQMAADTVRRGFLDGSHRIEVRNSNGRIVGTVTFAEAVQIKL
jgi:hypothetical protein